MAVIASTGKDIVKEFLASPAARFIAGYDDNILATRRIKQKMSSEPAGEGCYLPAGATNDK